MNTNFCSIRQHYIGIQHLTCNRIGNWCITICSIHNLHRRYCCYCLCSRPSCFSFAIFHSYCYTQCFSRIIRGYSIGWFGTQYSFWTFFVVPFICYIRIYRINTNFCSIRQHYIGIQHLTCTRIGNRSKSISPIYHCYGRYCYSRNGGCSCPSYFSFITFDSNCHTQFFTHIISGYSIGWLGTQYCIIAAFIVPFIGHSIIYRISTNFCSIRQHYIGIQYLTCNRIGNWCITIFPIYNFYRRYACYVPLRIQCGCFSYCIIFKIPWCCAGFISIPAAKSITCFGWICRFGQLVTSFYSNRCYRATAVSIKGNSISCNTAATAAAAAGGTTAAANYNRRFGIFIAVVIQYTI